MATLTIAQKLAKFGFPRSIINAFDKMVVAETNQVTGGIANTLWTGTLAEYNALPEKVATTLHLVAG